MHQTRIDPAVVFTWIDLIYISVYFYYFLSLCLSGLLLAWRYCESRQSLGRQTLNYILLLLLLLLKKLRHFSKVRIRR